MTTSSNPIDDFFDDEAERLRRERAGPIGQICQAYNAQDSDRLLGFVLELDYETMRIITCDSWKGKCGGVPRNSFIVVKLSEEAEGISPVLLFGRVVDASLTPVAGDIQRTIFQVHKLRALLDPLTNLELQWGALRVDILGTYYDETDPETGEVRIAFGSDMDHYRAPHFYEVYVPRPEHLELLINSFVDPDESTSIGRLRYTETETMPQSRPVQVYVSPTDFVANRCALFGKTRTGKSNMVKVILDMMLRSALRLGQIVFDPSGEYTYPDPQTGASIYLAHPHRCTRYSLHPRRPARELQANVQPPAMLRANFYQHLVLGHTIIKTLFDSHHKNKGRPDYMAAFFDWDPIDLEEIPDRLPEMSEQRRYRRALAMYQALLYEAGFQVGDRTPKVQLCLSEAIRERLAQMSTLQGVGHRDHKADGTELLADYQPLPLAARIYEQLWSLYEQAPANRTLWPISKASGKPYLEPIHVALLRMLGDSSISGAKKVTPFTDYHSPAGTDVSRAIVEDVQQGRTVFVDFASADPAVAIYFSELICRALLARQMERFAVLEKEAFDADSVLIYFEEAHQLFRSDDRDLNSIYNKLAKEGAKFRIGIIFATQSMTTLSPDLLKNTENLIVSHLNDDREIRELERRIEFRGMGADLQRCRTRGYTRMCTLSQRFALPVQIKRFTLEEER